MYDNVMTRQLINDAIRFVMDFTMGMHSEAFEFGWKMATLRQRFQTRYHFFESAEKSSRPPWSIMNGDEMVNGQQVTLRFRQNGD